MNSTRLDPSGHGRGWPLLAMLVAGVVLIAGILFVFADPLGGSSDDSPVRYTEAIVGSPTRINPLFVHMSDVDRDISSLVFSGLTRLDKEGRPVGDLAEDWEVAEDGLSVTFNLRSGVTWHNGEPFTAQDVAFTYGLLANPALQGDPEQATLWQSVVCTAPDDQTVACQLPEPYSPFLAYASVGILPRHILESATPESLLEDPFNEAPVGTGPYRLAVLDAASALLTANGRHHLDTPDIDEIALRFYPDSATAAAGILRGEAEGLLVDLTINPEDLDSLQSVDGLAQHPASRGAYTMLYLNNTAPVVNDPDVRRAIARAIDTDSIISALLDGRAGRTDTPILPGTWPFEPGFDGYSHDIGEARQMLEEAGWLLAEGSSVREKEGTELRIVLVTDEDPLRAAIGDLIAQQLADAGILASVVRKPSTELVRDLLLPRQYQAAIFGWDPGLDPDPYPAWHSSQALEGGRNLAGYTSDAADEVIEEGRREFDYDERKEAYIRFQQLFLEDIPSIPLFAPQSTYLMSEDVQNVDIGVLFTTASRFRNITEWAVERSSVVGG
jgi:peptide/nickel transport system substrate-binding protein